MPTKAAVLFTREDVRKINQDLITGKNRDITKLSPASRAILRQSTFTRDEINTAYAAARRASLG